VRTVRETSHSPLVLELADDREGAHARVELSPSRGGMATRFRVGDRDLFYMDAATLADPTKNVRGGNPVLFPSPGKLDGDTWTYAGQSGRLDQHGFGRKLPWRVVATSNDKNLATASFTLESSDATRALWPWEFAVTLTYSLAGTTLRIMQWVQNRSDDPMPFGIGFHPYFLVKDKRGARIPTAATRAFDNVAKQEVPFAGFDLTQPEVDLHLIDHGSTEAALHFGEVDGGGKIILRGAPELSRWVVWTVAGKDYVCLEPWSCPANALNTGEGLLVLEMGEARVIALEVELSSA
jgi:galactose mutarotase-like enzyme